MRAAEVPRGTVDLIEEIGTEQGPVDDDALCGRLCSSPRLVTEEPHLDPRTALWRIHRLVPWLDDDGHVVEHECLLHRSSLPLSTLRLATSARDPRFRGFCVEACARAATNDNECSRSTRTICRRRDVRGCRDDGVRRGLATDNRGGTMAGVESRDFSAPDETRTPDKTTVELVNLAGGQIGRYTFQPGWKWSECIKPVVGTDSCQVEHIGYVVSGSCTSTTRTAARARSSRATSTGSRPATTPGSSATSRPCSSSSRAPRTTPSPADRGPGRRSYSVPQGRGRGNACRRASGEDRRDDGGAVRHRAPDQSADHDPDRDADRHPDARDHRRLPRDHRRELPAGEPEGLQDGELAPAHRTGAPAKARPAARARRGGAATPATRRQRRARHRRGLHRAVAARARVLAGLG